VQRLCCISFAFSVIGRETVSKTQCVFVFWRSTRVGAVLSCCCRMKISICIIERRTRQIAFANLPLVNWIFGSALGPAAVLTAREGERGRSPWLSGCMHMRRSTALSALDSQFGYNYIQLTLYGNLHVHAWDKTYAKSSARVVRILHFPRATHSRAIIYA
jgi:hypothetical protein